MASMSRARTAFQRPRGCRSGHPTEHRRAARSLSGPVLVAPPDPELLHAATERARIEAENLRRAARTIDDPLALLECANDVLTLDVLERRCARGTLRVRTHPVCRPHSRFALRRLEELRPQLELASRRQDHRALDDVLQLADVSRPGVLCQPLHRVVAYRVHVPADLR